MSFTSQSRLRNKESAVLPTTGLQYHVRVPPFRNDSQSSKHDHYNFVDTMAPVMVSEIPKCKTPEERERRAKDLESWKVSKYSLKVYPPYSEVPGMTLDILRDRHKSVYDNYYSELFSSFKNVVNSESSIESRKNDAARQAKNAGNQTKPSLDSLFCIGIGSVSHADRVTYSATSGTLTQVVIYEAIRDVLQEVYSFETSYVQDPSFNQLDQVFMADRGFTVTRTVEADMTSESCLFVTPMEVIVPSCLIADYQPKLLITNCFDSPDKTKENSGNYAKHQHFKKTHVKHDNFFQDRADRKYEYWVRTD